MPKQRSKNNHLPERVYISHGSHFYVDRANKWHNLGRKYAEAMVRYAGLICTDKGKTISQIMDRYIRDVIPGKAHATQIDNLREIDQLRPVFGAMNPSQITPTHIHQYLDKRTAEVRGLREKACLSHLFNKAIAWGYASTNPCSQVKRQRRKESIKPKRYVTDSEFKAVCKIAPKPIRLAMELSYLTGLRKGDLLRLKWGADDKDGLHVRTGKTNTPICFTWTAELKALIRECRKRPTRFSCDYIIHGAKGKPYTTSGFDTEWQKVQRAWAKSGGERFTFHNIRSKAGTDVQQNRGIEDARQLLTHATQQMTQAYLVGEHKVKPTK
jgi:integrase